MGVWADTVWNTRLQGHMQGAGIRLELSVGPQHIHLPDREKLSHAKHSPSLPLPPSPSSLPRSRQVGSGISWGTGTTGVDTAGQCDLAERGRPKLSCARGRVGRRKSRAAQRK